MDDLRFFARLSLRRFIDFSSCRFVPWFVRDVDGMMTMTCDDGSDDEPDAVCSSMLLVQESGPQDMRQ